MNTKTRAPRYLLSLSVATLLLAPVAGSALAQEQPATSPPSQDLPPPPPPPDSEGRVTGMTPPKYPQKELRDGIGGVTLVAVAINDKGDVLMVSVLESSRNKNLDAAAVAAAWTWKFNPGFRDGVRVGGTVLVPVNFNPG